tara:strand:- start:333 stop:1634 length:1302 start_codon:yes stop_codon:yes gene_type:complete|mmetsp:Transcript_851/g.2859  ORF Transcript_851/g.2859 Transcript_851/m.2859 type:complete len:434 (-) Transcript_851:323-1624(-)
MSLTDVDRFEGTEWEDAVDALRKEAIERRESDGHSYFDGLLRMSSHDMRATISSHERSLKKVSGDHTEGLQLRLDLLKKLHPLQEKFEEKAQHEADAKKQSQEDAFNFDESPDDDGTHAGQLKSYSNKHNTAHKATASGTRHLSYKPVYENGNNSRPGGYFGMNMQKSAGPSSRGAAMMQAAHEKNAGRTVGEQRAAPRKKAVLDLVKIKPADLYRPPTASRTTRRAREADAEYLPGFPPPAQNTLFSPPLKTSARKAARKTECIELLSDDEEADGAGPAGTIVLGGDEVPRVSTRPTRSSVRLSIPDRIGNIKVIFPIMSINKNSRRWRESDAFHRHRRGDFKGPPHARGHRVSQRQCDRVLHQKITAQHDSGCGEAVSHLQLVFLREAHERPGRTERARGREAEKSARARCEVDKGRLSPGPRATNRSYRC